MRCYFRVSASRIGASCSANFGLEWHYLDPSVRRRLEVLPPLCAQVRNVPRSVATLQSTRLQNVNYNTFSSPLWHFTCTLWCDVFMHAAIHCIQQNTSGTSTLSSTPKHSSGGGGGMRSPGLAKKMRQKCGKCGKKCSRKCGFVRMMFAPRNPYVSSRLAQSGAQSMDGLMEQLSAVVQLKNITD